MVWVDLGYATLAHCALTDSTRGAAYAFAASVGRSDDAHNVLPRTFRPDAQWDLRPSMRAILSDWMIDVAVSLTPLSSEPSSSVSFPR